MAKPCIYKHSCAIEVCMMEDCPEYKAKKRGEPYFGEEKTTQPAEKGS